MTLLMLWMGALLTAWMREMLDWPWWIWLGYAACAAGAVTSRVVARRERTLMFHALLDLRDGVDAERLERGSIVPRRPSLF